MPSDTFEGELLLLSVPDVPEASAFGAAVDWVEAKRKDAFSVQVAADMVEAK